VKLGELHRARWAVNQHDADDLFGVKDADAAAAGESWQVAAGDEHRQQGGDAFEIRAVGSPQILTGTLTRTGGVIAQIGATYPDVQLTVTPVDMLTLPATERTLVPAHGNPRL